MPPRKGRPAKAAGDAKTAREPGPARLLVVADAALGGVPAGLPALPERLRAVAAGASKAAFAALVGRAAEGADAVLFTGRLLDPAADVRAETALRDGLGRLAAAGVTAFARTAERLPDGLPLEVLAPDEPSETELARGGTPLAVLRVLAGDAAFPVPDGLPVVGLPHAGADDVDGCDLIIPPAGPRRTVRDENAVTHHPGPLGGGAASLVTLPAAAGAGDLTVKPVHVSPVRFLSLSADLLEEPADLAADLRARLADEPARQGEKLRVVSWTLRVGPWGDGLLEPGRAAGSRAAVDDPAATPAVLNRLTVVPHPDRFGGGEGATFLETLAHFDPLGEADALPGALAGVPAGPARVRALATRFALPLADAD